MQTRQLLSEHPKLRDEARALLLPTSTIEQLGHQLGDANKATAGVLDALEFAHPEEVQGYVVLISQMMSDERELARYSDEAYANARKWVESRRHCLRDLLRNTSG